MDWFERVMYWLFILITFGGIVILNSQIPTSAVIESTTVTPDYTTFQIHRATIYVDNGVFHVEGGMDIVSDKELYKEE